MRNIGYLKMTESSRNLRLVQPTFCIQIATALYGHQGLLGPLGGLCWFYNNDASKARYSTQFVKDEMDIIAVFSPCILPELGKSSLIALDC